MHQVWLTTQESRGLMTRTVSPDALPDCALDGSGELIDGRLEIDHAETVERIPEPILGPLDINGPLVSMAPSLVLCGFSDMRDACFDRYVSAHQLMNVYAARRMSSASAR